MANIAQTINVLQAMALTDKEKLLLTPTYHVFEMYTVHHDATLLPCEVQCPEIARGEDHVPILHASASRDARGRVHVTVCNLDPSQAVETTLSLQGLNPATVKGRVLTADAITAHNTFERPEAVKPAELKVVNRTAEGLAIPLPARSVTVLELQ
jgi:alpha-N-arabinofuranosidase